ncbi:hypothetical protein GCM10007207_29300 [Asaia siamensis]|uniref:Transposase n=1 Tax=Asaia siamensis TaxID=110479 RepID=A0ABQ1MPX6_9PROT|nr:transposase [Asaia siamensis NRIC 0323]GGC42150.1 hypothetical protein GCM10007207_29300 [Asaia siamensis]
MVSIAGKTGCSTHTLSEWVKKAKVATGKRAAVRSEIAHRLKALERENRGTLTQVLRKASAYFA